MKDKRIWVVIGCILIIGTGVTHYTEYYVKSQSAAVTETQAPSGDVPADSPSPDLSALPQDGITDGEARAVPSGRSREAAAPDSVSGPGGAADGHTVNGSEEADTKGSSDRADTGETPPNQALAEGDAPDQEVPMSPLTSAKGSGAKSGSQVDYRQRLMDLDTQIQKMREQETDSNVYSIKTSAETELKMWESEVNTIYNALIGVLTPDEAARLAADQQEWMKNRDSDAANRSDKSNPSVESLGYAATLVSLTRERAYDLAGWYEKATGSGTDSGEEAPPAAGVP